MDQELGINFYYHPPAFLHDERLELQVEKMVSTFGKLNFFALLMFCHFLGILKIPKEFQSSTRRLPTQFQIENESIFFHFISAMTSEYKITWENGAHLVHHLNSGNETTTRYVLSANAFYACQVIIQLNFWLNIFSITANFLHIK